MCLIQKRLGIAIHYQQRHQVLEHGTRPRDERPLATDKRQLATQSKPMFLRYISFGDADETCESCFCSQQVVIRIVRLQLCNVVANGEELAIFVEQEREIHLMKNGF